MSKDRIKHVTIIGVGLLGGSIGLALKSRFGRIEVAGVGRRQSSLNDAMRIGAIDTAHMDVAYVVGRSDLVVLATPVCTFEEYLRAIQPLLKPGAMVTDVGSTKAVVCRQAKKILGEGVFIGSHPMAGSEKKGPTYARANMLRDATCILTPEAGTPSALTQRARELWEALGMRVISMTPRQHDRALARVSHLPHVLAGLLMLLPRDGELGVSASGLRDTTRLASGDVEMWRDILMTNRGSIVAALDAYDKSLRRLRGLVAAGDAKAIQKFLTAAKNRRDTTIAGPE